MEKLNWEKNSPAGFFFTGADVNADCKEESFYGDNNEHLVLLQFQC